MGRLINGHVLPDRIHGVIIESQQVWDSRKDMWRKSAYMQHIWLNCKYNRWCRCSNSKRKLSYIKLMWPSNSRLFNSRKLNIFNRLWLITRP